MLILTTHPPSLIGAAARRPPREAQLTMLILTTHLPSLSLIGAAARRPPREGSHARSDQAALSLAGAHAPPPRKNPDPHRALTPTRSRSRTRTLHPAPPLIRRSSTPSVTSRASERPPVYHPSWPPPPSLCCDLAPRTLDLTRTCARDVRCAEVRAMRGDVRNDGHARCRAAGMQGCRPHTARGHSLSRLGVLFLRLYNVITLGDVVRFTLMYLLFHSTCFPGALGGHPPSARPVAQRYRSKAVK